MKGAAEDLRHGTVSWPYTLPSLNVDLDPGGYLEDLGAILEVLGPMVITM